tara:strand:+ start:129 stop:437 length:309 start_codon:yes stop_codon:yes gene_type:complete
MNLESLIILEYLNHGLVPYFPKKKNQLLDQIVFNTGAKIAKRKFRKAYKKALTALEASTIQWKKDKYFGAPGCDPTPKQIRNRKRLVYRYIRSLVENKYKVP